MRLLPRITYGWRTVQFGPFVDTADGFTRKTTLTITPAHTLLSKGGGGAFVTKNESSNAVHDVNGWYRVKFNEIDLNTFGELVVEFNIPGALPVWERFLVVPEGLWLAYTHATAGYITLKQLRLASDDGMIPLDIDAGSPCGVQAVRIRAQRAGESALQIVGPAAGAAVDISVASGAADAVKIVAGPSGGSVFSLAAPGTGASRVFNMSSAGDLVIRAANHGGSGVLGLVGSGTAPVIDITVPTGATGLRLNGGLKGIFIQPDNASGVGIEIYGNKPGMTGFKVDMVGAPSTAFDLSAGSTCLNLFAADAVVISGTTNGVVMEGESGYGVLIHGNGVGVAGMRIETRTGSGSGIMVRSRGAYPDIDARELAYSYGQATAGTAATITLKAGETYATNLLTGATIRIIGNTGAGQTRSIISNTNATPSVVTVDRNWTTNPDSSSVYELDISVDNQVTAGDVATDAIDADAIADNAIDAGAIASNAITSAKIATGAITNTKFAAGAIDAAAIAADAIGASELATGAAQKIRNEILSDEAKFNGADIALIKAQTDLVSTKIGTPADLGSGADIAKNLVDINAAAAANACLDDIKDLMFNRDVVARHPNQKPSQYTAGTGPNQITVNTTQDGSGNTETEVIAP